MSVVLIKSSGSKSQCVLIYSYNPSRTVGPFAAKVCLMVHIQSWSVLWHDWMAVFEDTKYRILDWMAVFKDTQDRILGWMTVFKDTKYRIVDWMAVFEDTKYRILDWMAVFKDT